MTIKDKLEKLNEPDYFNLLLFTLYKLTDNPEYRTLSELAYVLDKPNLLNLCQIYGGTSIHVPTIEELERLFNALLLYDKVDIENKDYKTTLQCFDTTMEEKRNIEHVYNVLKTVVKDYNFDYGRKNS